MDLYCSLSLEKNNMKIASIKLFGSKTKITNLSNSDASDPKKMWQKVLLVMLGFFILGVLIGGFFFRKVYKEEYKGEESTVEDEITSVINLESLKTATNKRLEYVNSSTTSTTDPAIQSSVSQ